MNYTQGHPEILETITIGSGEIYPPQGQSQSSPIPDFLHDSAQLAGRIVVLSDLEGTLHPEVWPLLAEAKNIPFFHQTTHDVDNYVDLMSQRLEIVRELSVPLDFFRGLVSEVTMFEGARDFINEIRSTYGTPLILTDCFYELVEPMSYDLGDSHVVAQHLLLENDLISGAQLTPNHKLALTRHLQRLGAVVFAVGDGRNDMPMLEQANLGVLLNTNGDIVHDHPDVYATNSYEKILSFFESSKFNT